MTFDNVMIVLLVISIVVSIAALRQSILNRQILKARGLDSAHVVISLGKEGAVMRNVRVSTSGREPPRVEVHQDAQGAVVSGNVFSSS